MPIVTLTSDFGYQDHYAAVIKAQILQHCPSATLVDISHGITPFSIAQGAHVLKASYHAFPPGTVHIFAVQGSAIAEQYIAFLWNGHYFLGRDNGFVGLLTATEVEQCVVLDSVDDSMPTFPTQALTLPAAKLAQGVSLSEIGTSTNSPQRLLPRQPRLTGQQITGHIIHIDHYGNLVSNITQEAFERLRNGRKFEIRFARETLYSLHTHYAQVAPGDCVCVFNSLALLEIAIYQGHAASLLGMREDSPVAISFV